MQTRSQRYAVMASVALTVVLAAACSSSTTAPLTSQQVAQGLDATYSQLLADGTSQDSEVAYLVAEYIEIGPAFGGNEGVFTAHTASGNQTWYGVGWSEIENSGVDTVYYAVLYPNRDLQQFVLVGVETGADTGHLTLATSNQFTSEAEDSLATLSASTVSSGGTCSLETGLAADSLLTLYTGGAVCTAGRFQWSFSATFPAAAGLGALESISGSTSFNGPIFSPSGGSHFVGIPSKSAAVADLIQSLIHRKR
jgi:hypothetical protein